MGMTVFVYRTDLGDSTNNGLSANVNQLTVVNVEGPFEPDASAPAVKLVRADFGFGSKVKLVPCDADGNETEGWFMDGGNAAGTSDSRWSRAIEEISGSKMGLTIVDIHDRQE